MSDSCTPEFFTVITDEDRTLPLQLLKKNNRPYSLAGATAIKARFVNADNTILEVTLAGGAIAIVDSAAGRITVTLTDAQVALLKVKDRQDFDIIVEKGTEKRRGKARGALTVEKPAAP